MASSSNFGRGPSPTPTERSARRAEAAATQPSGGAAPRPLSNAHIRSSQAHSATTPTGAHSRSVPSGSAIPRHSVQQHGSGQYEGADLGGYNSDANSYIVQDDYRISDPRQHSRAHMRAQRDDTHDDTTTTDTSDTDAAETKRTSSRKKRKQPATKSATPKAPALAPDGSGFKMPTQAQVIRPRSDRIYSTDGKYEFRTQKRAVKSNPNENYERPFQKTKWSMPLKHRDSINSRDHGFTERGKSLSRFRRLKLLFRNWRSASLTSRELSERHFHTTREALNTAQVSKLARRVHKQFSRELSRTPRNYDMLLRLATTAHEIERDYYGGDNWQFRDLGNHTEQQSLRLLQRVINDYNLMVRTTKKQFDRLGDYFSEHKVKTASTGQQLYQQYTRHVNNGLFDDPLNDYVDFLAWFKLTDKVTANAQLRYEYRGNKTAQDILDLIGENTIPDYERATLLRECIKVTLQDRNHFPDAADYNSLYYLLANALDTHSEDERNILAYKIMWSLAHRGEPFRRRTYNEYLAKRAKEKAQAGAAGGAYPIDDDGNVTSGPEHNFYGKIGPDGEPIDSDSEPTKRKSGKGHKRRSGLDRSSEPTGQTPPPQFQGVIQEQGQEVGNTTPPTPPPAGGTSDPQQATEATPPPAGDPGAPPQATGSATPPAGGASDPQQATGGATPPAAGTPPQPAGGTGDPAQQATGGAPAYRNIAELKAELARLGLQYTPTKITLEHEIGEHNRKITEFNLTITHLEQQLKEAQARPDQGPKTQADIQRINIDLGNTRAWVTWTQAEIQKLQVQIQNLPVTPPQGAPADPTGKVYTGLFRLETPAVFRADGDYMYIDNTTGQRIHANPARALHSYLGKFAGLEPGEHVMRWLDAAENAYGKFISPICQPNGPVAQPSKMDVISAWRATFFDPNETNPLENEHIAVFVMALERLEADNKLSAPMLWMLNEIAKDGPKMQKYAQAFVDHFTIQHREMMTAIAQAEKQRITDSNTTEAKQEFVNRMKAFSNTAKSLINAQDGRRLLFTAASSQSLRSVRVPYYGTEHMIQRYVDRMGGADMNKGFLDTATQVGKKLGITDESDMQAFIEALDIVALDNPALGAWIRLGAMAQENRPDWASEVPTHTTDTAKMIVREMVELGKRSLAKPEHMQLLINGIIQKPKWDYSKTLVK